MISQELPWAEQPPEQERAREIPKVSLGTPKSLAKPKNYSFDLSSLKKPTQTSARSIPKVNQPVVKTSPALPSLKPPKPSAAKASDQSATPPKPSQPIQPFQAPIASVPSQRISSPLVPPQLAQSQSIPIKPVSSPSIQAPPAHPSNSSAKGTIVTPPKLDPDQLKPVVRHPNLSLPSFKPIATKPVATHDRPLTAMHLLREIEATIIGWQQTLQQLKDQIQALYAEGPIVDGWLESRSHPGEVVGSGLSRSGRRLKLGRRSVISQQIVSAMEASPETEYYLCGYDETGEFWSRPCPPEQVASISLALARHQRLQQLLKQKQKVEIYQGEMAETLIEFHTQIRNIGRRG